MTRFQVDVASLLNKKKARSVLFILASCKNVSSKLICPLWKKKERRLHKHTWFCGGDKQTLQQTYFRRSASCVQSFDDSLDIAIRITYRISLRSSSLWEPRHPLLKVLDRYFVFTKIPNQARYYVLTVIMFWFWFVFIFQRNVKGFDLSGERQECCLCFVSTGHVFIPLDESRRIRTFSALFAP